MNFLDKVIDRFRPYGTARQRRRQAIGLRRTYQAALSNRLNQDWSMVQTSANAELRRSLRWLRARSRELARNNAYMKKFLRMTMTNVIGAGGVRLQLRLADGSSSGGNGNGSRGSMDEKLIGKIEEAWQEWCLPENCSASTKLSWIDQQGLFIRTIARDGEVLVRKVYGADNPFGFSLRFQDVAWLDETWNMIVPGNNRVLMSVEVDENDRPVIYWLTRPASDYLYPEFNQPYYRFPVPASEIIHRFLVLEDELQIRGVPWAHAAMNDTAILSGYEEAELVAARSAACKMAYLIPPKDELEGIPDSDQEGDIEIGEEIQPGITPVLPPGYDMKPFDPTHPHPGYDRFHNAVLRKIASGLEVSYISLANDLTGVNYSSIRAGLLEERDIWRTLQRFVIDHFCHPVFREWLKAAMLSGALDISVRDYSRVRDHWRPRGWDWVDPLKDVQATILAVNNALTSRTDELDAVGEEFEVVAGKLGAERKRMKELDIDIVPPVEPKPTVKKETKEEDVEEGVETESRVLPSFETPQWVQPVSAAMATRHLPWS